MTTYVVLFIQTDLGFMDNTYLADHYRKNMSKLDEQATEVNRFIESDLLAKKKTPDIGEVRKFLINFKMENLGNGLNDTKTMRRLAPPYTLEEFLLAPISHCYCLYFGSDRKLKRIVKR